jgi:hypothetical protein
MTCLVSRLVELYNSLCAYKKRNILSCMTTTHTMVVKLSHETVVSFGCFARQRPLSLSLLSLLHVIKNLMWHCMGRPMGLLMCNNVLALICSSTDLKATSADLLWEKNIVQAKNTHTKTLCKKWLMRARSQTACYH